MWAESRTQGLLSSGSLDVEKLWTEAVTKYFVTRRIKTFMGCLNIFIIDLHQELLKDFSSSFKCNLAATTTSDKLQNTEYRILEATVRDETCRAGIVDSLERGKQHDSALPACRMRVGTAMIPQHDFPEFLLSLVIFY
ncbi:PREDICTED: uncharacterized protein LOC105574469 isoform X2 [Cercocebus atys]|uniref:uncharacterized protein LOC105574469 isoform X2 n=1 Tax=Cercocebus atys TaxID=9531 RepID=UPI0005F45FFC|nr:PREDICTED: uncharacterized protein LOC105574469 isoform X2 [Cercocebus atys]